jgi:hypothetical protein
MIHHLAEGCVSCCPQRLLTCALQSGMPLAEVESRLTDDSRGATLALRLGVADNAVAVKPTFSQPNNGNGMSPLGVAERFLWYQAERPEIYAPSPLARGVDCAHTPSRAYPRGGVPPATERKLHLVTPLGC